MPPAFDVLADANRCTADMLSRAKLSLQKYQSLNKPRLTATDPYKPWPRERPGNSTPTKRTAQEMPLAQCLEATSIVKPKMQPPLSDEGPRPVSPRKLNSVSVPGFIGVTTRPMLPFPVVRRKYAAPSGDGEGKLLEELLPPVLGPPDPSRKRFSLALPSPNNTVATVTRPKSKQQTANRPPTTSPRDGVHVQVRTPGDLCAL